ncbi:hypothetical protein Ocin01_11004 [Orchesella cincta]|uniref:Uncharacterized protein n=1 Tax=Orchesella cincta TaxID=48709 RepID=A0A1D2MRH3_ORCCI|nr:hypothetical protein Ocin01_11004 [Orchesella cincta]
MITYHVGCLHAGIYDSNVTCLAKMTKRLHRFPNYRYSTVAATSGGRSTPPPILANKSRTELGSGSIKSPASPLEAQKLLDKDHHRSTPPIWTPAPGSPYTPPGRAVRQDTGTSSDTQQSQVSQKSSPTHLSNVLNYLDGSSRRSSTPTPTTTSNFQMRPKSPFESCGPHVDPQQRRYSTPSSPTMYAYQQRPPQGPSNYSSMSYLPEVRTYLHFMEDDFSNRQRSHSFSGRSTRRSLRRNAKVRVPRSPSPFALERTMVEDNGSNISSPSSFNTTYLTPPGSTDQGSFKSPESGTPDWLLNSDVPPTHLDVEEAINLYKQQLSRSSSIRTAFV